MSPPSAQADRRESALELALQQRQERRRARQRQRDQHRQQLLLGLPAFSPTASAAPAPTAAAGRPGTAAGGRVGAVCYGGCSSSDAAEADTSGRPCCSPSLHLAAPPSLLLNDPSAFNAFRGYDSYDGDESPVDDQSSLDTCQLSSPGSQPSQPSCFLKPPSLCSSFSAEREIACTAENSCHSIVCPSDAAVSTMPRGSLPLHTKLEAWEEFRQRVEQAKAQRPKARHVRQGLTSAAASALSYCSSPGRSTEAYRKLMPDCQLEGTLSPLSPGLRRSSSLKDRAMTPIGMPKGSHHTRRHHTVSDVKMEEKDYAHMGNPLQGRRHTEEHGLPSLVLPPVCQGSCCQPIPVPPHPHSQSRSRMCAASCQPTKAIEPPPLPLLSVHPGNSQACCHTDAESKLRQWKLQSLRCYIQYQAAQAGYGSYSTGMEAEAEQDSGYVHERGLSFSEWMSVRQAECRHSRDDTPTSDHGFLQPVSEDLEAPCRLDGGDHQELQEGLLSCSLGPVQNLEGAMLGWSAPSCPSMMLQALAPESKERKPSFSDWIG